MKTILLTVLIFSISFVLVHAQIEATTIDGKKVILNDNGTWNYITPKSPVESTIEYECSDLVSTHTDKMTGESYLAPKQTILVSKDVGKTGIGIDFMQSDNMLILMIQAIGAGRCIDDDDKMNVLFRDGTRLELENDGDFNCENEFTLYFGGVFGKREEMSLLQKKEIESMRIWTKDGFVERDFSSIQSQKFMQIVDCLVKSE